MPEDATTLSVPENPLKDDITRLLDGGPAAEPEARPLLSSIGRATGSCACWARAAWAPCSGATYKACAR
jgi:hypothetical protein